MNYRKILLVDDDEDDQEIFFTALQKVAPAVVCEMLNSACSALERLKNGQVSPDIIFLDLNMPIMNGQQFLAEIKKDAGLKDIPVVVISTSSHPQTIQLAKDTGAKDFITKPDKFDDLVKILVSLLD